MPEQMASGRGALSGPDGEPGVSSQNLYMPFNSFLTGVGRVSPAGCQSQQYFDQRRSNATMNHKMSYRTGMTATAALLAMSLSVAAGAAGNGAVRVMDALWAGDRLFDTVLTPTSFIAPPERSTDTLYNFSMSGLLGQRGVSEAYPGTPDYNGGRWSVKVVVFTPQGVAVHDADGNGIVDFELTSAAAVLEHQALGHVEIMDTSIYFECPLLP